MTPIQLITFAKSRVEKIGRASGVSVIGTAEGDNSRDYDSEIYQSHGLVSRPSGKTRGIRIRIGNLAFVIASYTYGIEPPANEGATKLYSTDAGGVEKASMLLDNDGAIKEKAASIDIEATGAIKEKGASVTVEATGSNKQSGLTVELNGATKVFVTGAELQAALTASDGMINTEFGKIAILLNGLLGPGSYTPTPVVTTITSAFTTTVKTGG